VGGDDGARRACECRSRIDALLDCSSANVSASVSETVYQKLWIGQPATFKPSGGGAEVMGSIVDLTGLAAVASNNAIQPKALSGAPLSRDT
jgi:hypothetical protein